MKILPGTRRRVFYDRFRQLARNGEVVEMPGMEAIWACSGLRRSDLFNTLREMSADHLVVLDCSDSSPRIRLTHAGQEEEQRVRNQILSRLRHWWSLSRISARSIGSTNGVTGRRRRRDDHGTPGKSPNACGT